MVVNCSGARGEFCSCFVTLLVYVFKQRVVLLRRDLKMENIMLNEKQKSIKLIGEKVF